ncbi:hypothetical protein [Sunxiuqinia sp. sy24]|uniref:hypothetical protein n=1 Tax=Sunxiuqinia sp. sy24 TaxID=3461495 RepID=UPI0040455C95
MTTIQLPVDQLKETSNHAPPQQFQFGQDSETSSERRATPAGLHQLLPSLFEERGKACEAGLGRIPCRSFATTIPHFTTRRNARRPEKNADRRWGELTFRFE